MQLSSTLVKTAKGLEEIDKRTYKLSGRLRAVMFMIDGQRSVGSLLEQAGSMASQLETQLTELLAQGFIEEIESDEGNISPSEPQPMPAAVKPEKPSSEPPVTQPAIKPPAPVQKANTASLVPPSPSPPQPKIREPISVVKERLSKMLAETMGMRAMFITTQLNSLQTYPEIERFIDDTARSQATSSSIKAAEQWRVRARSVAGL
jgi:DNA-binding FrmR family transcriptional regulator